MYLIFWKLIHKFHLIQFKRALHKFENYIVMWITVLVIFKFV